MEIPKIPKIPKRHDFTFRGKKSLESAKIGKKKFRVGRVTLTTHFSSSLAL